MNREASILVIDRLGYPRSMILGVDGLSGGIWFIWNDHVVDIVGRCTGDIILHANYHHENFEHRELDYFFYLCIKLCRRTSPWVGGD